jgi:hypothetical protein
MANENVLWLEPQQRSDGSPADDAHPDENGCKKIITTYAIVPTPSVSIILSLKYKKFSRRGNSQRAAALGSRIS